MMAGRIMENDFYTNGYYSNDNDSINTAAYNTSNGQHHSNTEGMMLMMGAGSMGDEEVEDVLEFDNQGQPRDVVEAMGHLRRQNQFCDAVLRVGEKEVQVHRAVLAACSPFFFELFDRSAETHYSDTHHTASMYKVKDVTFTSFSYILDYMYSGRLIVGASDVGEVYRTAKLLRMEQAAEACSAFLVARLTPSSCLGLRLCAEDLTLRGQIDDFIQGDVDSVINSKHFFGLPQVKVEIIGAEEALENEGSVSQLFNLVLDWARLSVDLTHPKVELLAEELNVLYLNADNHLQDCKDMQDARMSDDDVVVDYKKHSRRRHCTPQSQLTNKQQTNGCGATEHPSVNLSGQGHPMPVLIFNIDPEGGVAEKEWSVIATHKQKGDSYMGLAVMSGKMMSISLHLRQVAASPTSPSAVGGLTPVIAEAGDRCATLTPLKTMSSSRCAFGVCTWSDSFVVCGGYDRGECLVSAEVYHPGKRGWTKLPSMTVPRARFGAAALNKRIYAIGGSDGARDLDSVHYLGSDAKKWKVAAPLNAARSSAGVAELNGRLYCVGGCDGQISLKSCEVYDAERNKWSYIADLNQARSQAAVTVYEGRLVVVGGTDSWNCLSSVESYDPQADAWTFVSPLSTVRRGAGIDKVGDELWVVGGSDGASSLRSTEIYDNVSMSWRPGPALSVPRANVAAVSLGGNVYAVGGFSGKKFLNTMEVCAADSQDWCCYQPARRARSSGDLSSGDEQPASATNGNGTASNSDLESSGDDAR